LDRKDAIRLAQLRHQGSACPLCQRRWFEDDLRWHGGSPRVDHCHTSGRIRGLICGPCNLGMAAIDKGDEWIARAVAYRDGGLWLGTWAAYQAEFDLR
jgi:hypothetical protein